MEPQEGTGRGRWGTAGALVAAAMFFPVLDWPLLLVVALSALLAVLPPRRTVPAVLGAAGLALALAGLTAAGAGATPIAAWIVASVACFTLATLVRPGWAFLPRALSALGGAGVGVGAWLASTGAWSTLDAAVREQARKSTEQVVAQLTVQAPAGAPWVEVFERTAKAAGEAWWTAFPAFAALQTIAVLALAWWIFARFAPHGGAWEQLRPLREFRFSDHMVWIVIAGLLLVVLPVGAEGARVGANALVFMGALYALRGIGVFLHATRVSPGLTALVLGIAALSPLMQFILVAALMVGLGDTWLDLRRRGAQVSRA